MKTIAYLNERSNTICIKVVKKRDDKNLCIDGLNFLILPFLKIFV